MTGGGAVSPWASNKAISSRRTVLFELTPSWIVARPCGSNWMTFEKVYFGDALDNGQEKRVYVPTAEFPKLADPEMSLREAIGPVEAVLPEKSDR